MKMKRKNAVRILALLAVLGTAILFESQVDSYTFSKTMEFKPIMPATPAVPEEYTGPQTVQALMNAFDAAYNRRHSKTTVSISGGKSSQLTVTEIDARYPRAAWLQLLLDKDITIRDFYEYASYLSERHTLAFFKANPDLWKTGFLGTLPTDDWETYKAYKAAYIDRSTKTAIVAAPQPPSYPTEPEDTTPPQPPSYPTEPEDTTPPQPPSYPTEPEDTTPPQPPSYPTEPEDTTPPQPNGSKRL